LVEGAHEFAPVSSGEDHVAVDESRDHELMSERVFSRWVAMGREAPPTLRRLVEATMADARPALESALFVVEMGREAVDSSLELHEAAAMWTLLGRLLGSHAGTATAALEFAGMIFDALSAEGFDVDPAIREALEAVFTEGYVLMREEHTRASIESEHLASLVPRRITEGIDLLVLTGPYEPARLAEALESWVREAFRSGTRVAVLDLLGARNLEAIARPLRETCLVLASLGIETLAVTTDSALEFPDHVKRATTFEDALTLALSPRDLSTFAMARMRRIFTRT
jgi:hypothetical protein